MKPLTALNFYILLIWVGIIAPCASAFGQGEEVEVPAEAIVYTKNGLVKIDLRKLCGVDGVVVGLHMDHLFLATPQFKLDGGILAKIAVNQTGMTRVDVDWLWRWTGAAWVRIPVTPEQLARVESEIISKRGERAETCAVAVQRVLLAADLIEHQNPIYSPVTLLRILARSPQSTIIHYRNLLSTVLSRNGLVEKVFVGFPLLGIVLKKVNPIFSPASLLGAPTAPLAREMRSLIRAFMKFPDKRPRIEPQRGTDLNSSPCQFTGRAPSSTPSRASPVAALAGSARTLFGPNFINYMTNYALLEAGVDPKFAEVAGIGAELISEAHQSGYLQSVTPFIPVALAAFRYKASALAATSTQALSAFTSWGLSSAQSATAAATTFATNAGRTAIAAVGGAVSGTAVAVAGAAGAVVAVGMIGYIEYTWGGIDDEKKKYLIEIGDSWWSQCKKGHLFPNLGGDKFLCSQAVQKKIDQESKRYDSDLLADNKCTWYALWCRS